MTDEQLEIFLMNWGGQFADLSARSCSVRALLIAYLIDGRRCGLSQAELIDYLGVSSQSVLDRSGMSAFNQEMAFATLASITDNELRGAE